MIIGKLDLDKEFEEAKRKINASIFGYVKSSFVIHGDDFGSRRITMGDYELAKSSSISAIKSSDGSALLMIRSNAIEFAGDGK